MFTLKVGNKQEQGKNIFGFCEVVEKNFCQISQFTLIITRKEENNMNDMRIKEMVGYVVRYLNSYYPENLEAMVHLIGHDERFRKKVEVITEAIIDHHDELFVACSSEKKLEDITPKYAKQCEEIRSKMRKVVDDYLSEE